MKREEEILQVANENYSGYSERRLGFIAGANWADKTMLDRACGNGAKSQAFELGAEWMQEQIPQINDLARQAYDTAIIRGKTSKDLSHEDTFFGILEELKEFRVAYETGKSQHLPEYTEAQEELADILICCLTELHRRGTDVEEIIKAKIEFNKTRQ